jgi:V8-like Glu-specific endopeptidase
LAGDPLPPPLPLGQALPIAAGQKLYLVGFPARDPRLDETFSASVYSGVYDVKRVSCGRMLALSDEQVFHDCFTAPGSSGAPVIDLESGQVIGVHLINSPGEGRIALNVTSLLSRPMLAALGLPSQAAQTAP